MRTAIALLLGFLAFSTSALAQGTNPVWVYGGTSGISVGVGGLFTATQDAAFNVHVRASGAAPALTSCGTSPAISGSDVAGLVTVNAPPAKAVGFSGKLCGNPLAWCLKATVPSRRH